MSVGSLLTPMWHSFACVGKGINREFCAPLRGKANLSQPDPRLGLHGLDIQATSCGAISMKPFHVCVFGKVTFASILNSLDSCAIQVVCLQVQSAFF